MPNGDHQALLLYRDALVQGSVRRWPRVLNSARGAAQRAGPVRSSRDPRSSQLTETHHAEPSGRVPRLQGDLQ